MGAYLALRPVFSAIRAKYTEHIDLRRQNTDAVIALAAALEKASSKEAVEATNALIQGLVKVCEAQVAEVGKMRAAVAAFAKIVAPPDRDDKDVLEHHNEWEADQTFRKQQFMAEGMTEDEAMLHVQIENEKLVGSPVSL